MLKRFMVCLLMVVTLAGFASQAAAYFEPSPWTEESGYNRRMAQKLIFGIANTACGWIELVQEPYEAVQNNKSVWRAIPVGIFNGVVDTIGGVLHIVTFPVTSLDIELPERGVLGDSYIIPQK